MELKTPAAGGRYARYSAALPGDARGSPRLLCDECLHEAVVEIDAGVEIRSADAFVLAVRTSIALLYEKAGYSVRRNPGSAQESSIRHARLHARHKRDLRPHGG